MEAGDFVTAEQHLSLAWSHLEAMFGASECTLSPAELSETRVTASSALALRSDAVRMRRGMRPWKLTKMSSCGNLESWKCHLVRRNWHLILSIHRERTSSTRHSTTEVFAWSCHDSKGLTAKAGVQLYQKGLIKEAIGWLEMVSAHKHVGPWILISSRAIMPFIKTRIKARFLISRGAFFERYPWP